MEADKVQHRGVSLHITKASFIARAEWTPVERGTWLVQYPWGLNSLMCTSWSCPAEALSALVAHTVLLRVHKNHKYSPFLTLPSGRVNTVHSHPAEGSSPAALHWPEPHVLPHC